MQEYLTLCVLLGSNGGRLVRGLTFAGDSGLPPPVFLSFLALLKITV